jgi:hypothetical protein
MPLIVLNIQKENIFIYHYMGGSQDSTGSHDLLHSAVIPNSGELRCLSSWHQWAEIDSCLISLRASVTSSPFSASSEVRCGLLPPTKAQCSVIILSPQVWQ